MTRKFRELGQVLYNLQKKYHWLHRNANIFFIAGNWQNDILTWISEYQSRKNITYLHKDYRGQRKNVTKNWVYLNDKTTSKVKFLETLVNDQRGNSISKASFYIFFDLNCNISTELQNIEGDLVRLPFTTSEAASYVKDQIKKKLKSSNTNSISSFNESSVKFLPNNYINERGSLNTFLIRQTSDVIAMDFLETLKLESLLKKENITNQVLNNAINTILLASYLLKPSGSILLRFPLESVGRESSFRHALLNYMRSSFQITACEVDMEYFYFVGCRSITDSPYAELAQDSFPRCTKNFDFTCPKRWNPRKDTKQNYFAALMPAFTNAPQIQETLNHDFAKEAETAKKAEDKEDKLLGLSIEMVKRGLYNCKRDD